jgi:hypothetical protein
MLKQKYLIWLFVFISTHLCVINSAYSWQYNGRKWYITDLPVPYSINQNGTPDCTGEFAAIQNSFQTWEDVGTAYMDYTYQGTTPNDDYGANDGENICGWIETGWPYSSSTIAVCVQWISGDHMVDADIAFNGQSFQWSISGEAGKYDVQNITTHEAGHTLSLHDLYGSGDTEKTMYGYSSAGETKKRTLDADDMAGISYIYPVLCGTVYDGFGGPLTSAHPYLVTCDVEVPTGRTLTIQPGTEVFFESGFKIISNGTINANGELNDPIYLVSNDTPHRGMKLMWDLVLKDGGEFKPGP